jgi:hypothetical protein
MEDVEKSGRMLRAEASQNRIVEVQDDQMEEEATIDGLARKYPGGCHCQLKGGRGKWKGGVQSPRVWLRTKIQLSEDRLFSSQH